ncbi:DUF4097 family beta strand repeat protein [Leucobacter sp. cx-42]|uniref:DUF4097 family beta strand repeat-containing protein n=1 Tax=unclassified Leucobacter TaxID=2621730 RepID=UPI00165E34D7|nr:MULTISPECIES: DUF4097 family beta strand repeat-containing protein [unclassified Leucobacter]MBC9955147.1 DUF4097 family beta strand repeat protein [Leucobacter sp. cx-42]
MQHSSKHVIRIRPVLAAGSLLAAALLMTGCASDGGSRAADPGASAEVSSESQTLEFAGQNLTIDAGTSDIILTSGGAAGAIAVETKVAGESNGSAPEVSTSLDGDVLSLAVDCTGFSLGCKGSFTVTVPEDVAVVAQNKNSDITVINFAADLTVSAVNGEASLSQVRGSTLTLTGKDMEVEAIGLAAQTVTADTRNGDIDLTFAEAPANVTVTGHDGDVRIALPGGDYRVNTTAKKGDAEVTVPQADSSPHVISVTTRNGDVEVVPAA